MSPEYKITLPLYTGGTRRQLKDGTLKPATKKYWLSMNNYRNWDHMASNTQKKRFKALIQDQVDKLPDLSALWGEIRLDYVFYPPNKTKRDVGNYVAVVDKFFCDCVVEANKLEDDNMFILRGSSWDFGDIDKDNPRMEVSIKPYRKQENTMDAAVYTPRKKTPQNADTLPADFDPTKRISFMQITLSEEELIQAAQNYVRAQLPVGKDDPMPVSFNAGRGDNGHTAILTIQSAPITVESPEKPMAHAEASFSAAKQAMDERNAAVQAEQASKTAEEPETAEPDAPETPEIAVSEPEAPVEPDIAPETSETFEPSEDPVDGMTDVDEVPPAVEQIQAETEKAAETSETTGLTSVFDKRDDPVQEDPQPNTRKASALFGGGSTEPNPQPTAKPKPVNIFDQV